MTPPRMATVRTVASLRAHVSAWREGRGVTTALVPTMGALHAGHISLIRLARAQADRVIASVFVNPRQFGAGEDFERYPRTEAEDARLLQEAGCDLLYAPTPEAMYPPGFATSLDVAGVSEPLEGASRPGHFSGMATVVAKLLLQARPDMAIFGEKDWQQLQVIRRLVRDLDLPIDILGAPIARDADGLALSSRNAYLTEEERARAPRLHMLMVQAAAALAKGAPVARVEEIGREALGKAGFRQVDYLQVRDGESLSAVDAGPLAAPARLLAAVWLGGTRLIDNLPVAPSPA
ncbi:MAG: pantoate--beta-alanine ligase [Caulobacteraceae bacterium]|nr:pantoate--beta-alanine ligase [Caulobacter sp.]